MNLGREGLCSSVFPLFSVKGEREEWQNLIGTVSRSSSRKKVVMVLSLENKESHLSAFMRGLFKHYKG